MKTDDLTIVRIGENQAMFRRANEDIELAADRLPLVGEVPFICECPREGCTELIRMTLEAYEEIRSNPQRFLTVPGHQDIAVDSGAGSVVEERESYVVVDKIGVAGEIAAKRYDELSD